MVQSLPQSDSFRILFNSPELSEVQRSGFHFFLKKGIAEELSKISCIPIKNVHFIVEVLVDAYNFRLVTPENSYSDCILKMKSYTCKLYVQTKTLFKDKLSGELLYQTQPEWVLLADLPMMTKRGHFIINGSPRIVVHQVGRAPGVYFKKVLKAKNDVTDKARFYGDIIPRKGVWVRLQINKKGEIDLKLKKSKKVRAEMIQKCLELLEKESSFSHLQNFVGGSQKKQSIVAHSTTTPSVVTTEIMQKHSSEYTNKVNQNYVLVQSKALLAKRKYFLEPKRSFGTQLRFCTRHKASHVRVFTTVKEQALLRNLFYFKGIKIAIDSTHFSEKLHRNRYSETCRLDLKKTSGLLPLDTNTCTSNKIIQSFVSNASSSKSFSAFTKTEKEAFANVYTSFYKTEIQDIEKRASVSNKALLRHTKPSSTTTLPLPVKSNLLSANELPIKLKKKSVPKTKYSQSSTEPQSLQSFVTTRALLKYSNKKRIVKKSNLSNNFQKIREYLHQLFKKSDFYDLGFVGREKINTKFEISVKETQLTALDIKKTINWLSKLRAGKEEIDDIDHSQNRRVRTSSELIQTQFEIGINRLKNGVLKRVLSPSGAINVKGDQIKASFYSKIRAKQSKMKFLEKGSNEELTKVRLFSCTNFFKHQSLAQTLFIQSQIKKNTALFYSQTLWQGNKQSGANKAKFCFTNNYTLHLVYYAQSISSSRVTATAKKRLYHSIFEYRNPTAKPLINYYLAIVFVQSHFGLQIIKVIPLQKLRSALPEQHTKLRFVSKNKVVQKGSTSFLQARTCKKEVLPFCTASLWFPVRVSGNVLQRKRSFVTQIKSNKKQVTFEFIKLYFKGGNSCFVKQDVTSVNITTSREKRQTGLVQSLEKRAQTSFVQKQSVPNRSFGTYKTFTKPERAELYVTGVIKQYKDLAFVWPVHSPRLSLALFKFSLTRADTLDKLWMHKQNGVLKRPDQSVAKTKEPKLRFGTCLCIQNSVFVTSLFAKHNITAFCSQGTAKIVKEQKNSTLTLDALYPLNDSVSDFSASEWFSTKPINGALREFFSSSPLSQYMDQTNPLAEVTHKRRLSSLGVGGVSRESAGMTIRGIHATHYGRICPIETPEGKNAGLVNSLAFYAKVNDQGFIETPYYQVIKGQVQHELGFSFYSAGQESRKALSIAPNDIKQSKSKLLASNISTVESVPVRIADNLLDLFNKKRVSQVDCIGISPLQILSVATSLIPFLEHNDANRALMGSNMQRQAVSLMNSERPLVGTGLEARVLAESGHLVQSKVSGFISHVSAHRVVVERLVYNFSANNTQAFIKAVLAKALLLQCLQKGSTSLCKTEVLPFCKHNVVFASTEQQNEVLLVVHRTKASFDWSIKKQNNYQKFTKLNSTISKIVAVLPQATKIKIRQSFLTEEFLKTKKIINKSYFKHSSEKNSMQIGSDSLYKLVKCIRHFEIFTKKGVALSPVIHSIMTFSRSNQETCLTQKVLVEEGDWVQRGDMLSDCSAGQKGELSVGKNMFIAYIPWQGYNFEDAIVISDRLVKEQLYTSLHIERYTVIVNDFKEKVVDSNEWFTGKLPGVDSKKRAHLQKSGLPRIGAVLREGDILVGKIKYSKKKPATPHEKLVCDILGEHNFSVQNTSLYVPKGVHEARVLTYKIKKRFDKALKTEIANKNEAVGFFAKAEQTKSQLWYGQEQHKTLLKGRVGDSTYLRPAGAPKVVHIFLGEKRNIQVGDKMSGRHGNKGIVSTILPKQDMPYLADGSPIDILLNPLGVPSRMNVGQVFECLLGLASTYLHQNFKISAFDELYGVEASQSLVFLKLYQARLQSGQNWLFQINFPGKTRLTDGRSGECLDQWITVGRAYMLKLIHMVNEKIHARAIGPYALVTQQPLKGRAHKGGQRLGEMEVWAIEGFGGAYILQELLTKKSDDSIGRKEVLKAMLPKSASLLDFADPFGQSVNTSMQSKANTTLKEDTILHDGSFLSSTQSSALVQHQAFTVLGQPDIFKVLICELQALCLDVGVYSIRTESFQRQFVGIFE